MIRQRHSPELEPHKESYRWRIATVAALGAIALAPVVNVYETIQDEATLSAMTDQECRIVDINYSPYFLEAPETYSEGEALATIEKQPPFWLQAILLPKTERVPVTIAANEDSYFAVDTQQNIEPEKLVTRSNGAITRLQMLDDATRVAISISPGCITEVRFAGQPTVAFELPISEPEQALD